MLDLYGSDIGECHTAVDNVHLVLCQGQTHGHSHCRGEEGAGTVDKRGGMGGGGGGGEGEKMKRCM